MTAKHLLQNGNYDSLALILLCSPPYPSGDGGAKNLGIDGVSSIPRVADSKSCLCGLLLLTAEELMEVLEALNRDLIAGRFHATPNGGSAGDHLDVGGEAFDDHVPGVLDRLEGCHDGLPIQRIVARSATVDAN